MRLLYIAVFILFFLSKAFSQEGGIAGNCGDGRDNDGDGFVDCYDKDCIAELVCEDFFLNNDATCEVRPDSFPKFTIRKLWFTEKRSVTNHTTLIVGDIKGNDGIPEIIGTQRGEKSIRMFDGRNGDLIASKTLNYDWWFQEYLAMGRIGPDPACGMIFMGNHNRIFALDCDLNVVWQTGSGGIPHAYNNEPVVSLADFNQDGRAELYYYNEIRDALTGQIIVKGTGDWNRKGNVGSLAVDVNPASPGLELIMGLTIYNVDIATGNLTIWRDQSANYYPKLRTTGDNNNRNFISVADYDLDGTMDVIANGAIGSVVGASCVYYWNLGTDVVKTFETPNNWYQGTGRVNLANIDDIPGLNATFVTGTKLYALDENFDLKWDIDIQELSSGNTGSSVFDFNGDGKSEIVYRDERFLYILQDGVDGGGNPAGIIRQAFPCRSRTGREYPIVADVNGDGETEICIACQHPSEPDINPKETGQIVVFASDGERWVPARKMWNQHGYFNVNVNDDLTIPVEQQKHHLVFSDVLCELDASGNPIPGEVRPLNSFQNNSPYLDINGCPSYAAPDITFAEADIDINAPICPETNFSTSFYIKNNGDVPINDDLNITFYKGDPNAGGQKLNTQTLYVNRLLSGDSLLIDSVVVQGDGTAFDLYIWLNNPNTIKECSEDNNIAMSRVVPLPFNVEAVKIGDNFKCDPAFPDNGSAEAFVVDGTDSLTAGYTFYWYDAAVDTLESTGAIVGGLGNGSFYVRATNDAIGCGSDTATVTINTVFDVPVVNVTVKNAMTSCTNPNGELQAFVDENGFDASADYTFTWFEGTQVYVNQHSVGQIATGLEERTYLVLAQNATNGCSGVRTGTVPLDITYPDVDITGFTNITNCINPYGTMTAQATMSGAAGDPSFFTFRWFASNTDDPLTEIFSETGPDIDSLDAGFYTVKVLVDSTQCESIAQSQEIIDLTTIPAVNISLVSEKTSCIRPNGSLTATANGGTSGFDFEWFRGINTTITLTTPESTSGSNGSVAENLTDMFYTVRATETATGCFATDSMRVPENPLNITISNVNVIHQTMCLPRNGEAEAFASGGSTGQYDYYWFDSNPGINPDTTMADFIGQQYTGLRAGNYWVVAADRQERCYSPPSLVTINPPAPLPDVNFAVTPNATCDPARPTGAVTATVVTGSNSDYSFRWFEGQTTNNSFRLPNASIPTAQTIGPNQETLIQVPDQIYTVRLQNNTTNCNDTAVVVVPTGPPPTITVTANSQDVDACIPPDGEVSANVGSNTSDYTFNWYQGTAIKATPDFTGSNETGLRQGDYTVQAISNLNGCESDPLTVNVGYISGITDISLVSDVLNDCVLTNGNIAASVTGGSGSFTYEWFVGPDTIPGNLVETSLTLNGYGIGTYTIKVTDTNTGCIEIDTASILTTEVVPIVNASATDATLCPANGTITAEVTNLGGIYTQADYSFYWFEGTNFVVDLADPDGFLEDYDVRDVSNLPAGDYTVIASQNYGDCRSVPVTVKVNEIAAPPAIAFASIANENCAAPFNGEITASASTSNGQPEPGSGYDFSWYNGRVTSLTGSSTALPSTGNNVMDHTLTGQDGDQYYAVIVTNQNTNCIDTADYRLLNDLENPFFVSHDKNDLTVCGTLGDIEITGLSVGTPTDYTYSWRAIDAASPPLPDVDETLANLDTGSYFVSAVYNVNRCPTNTMEVRIEDLLEYPAASLHLVQPQMSLNPGFLTGEIAADAIEQDGTVELYDFDWHFGSIPNSIIQTLNNTVDTLINRVEGDYHVIARNTTSNCRDTASMNLPLLPPTPEIIEVTVNHKTWCTPDNGSLLVDSLLLDGGGDDLSNYEFYWYQDTYVEDISQADFVTSTPALTGLREGTYYIVARHEDLWVQSNPYQIVIEDQSVIPQIALARRLPQTSCNPDPSGHNGLLRININGGVSPAAFNITWYASSNTSGSVLSSTDTTASGLTNRNYTVEVVNATTGCLDSATFFVPSDTPEVGLLTSVTPNRKCINPDGVLSAIVQPTDSYTVEWYAGSSIAGTPLYTGITIDSVSGGTYTAQAILASDPFCVSPPVTDSVPDILVYPAFDIEIDAPVSNCDLTRPNGQASVENIVPTATYTAEWVEVATSNIVTTGLIGTELSAQEYSITLLNTFTGCSTTNNVQIPEQLEVVPDPTVTVLSEMTSCETPNGALAADVEGNIIRYEFNWYDGSEEKSAVDYLGDTYEELDIGSYTVKAYDLITGCWSNTVTEDIQDGREYPQIFVSVTNSECELDNGTAALAIGNGVNADIVNWYNEMDQYEGVTIFDIPAGMYDLEVITPLGCKSTETFEVPTEIKIYNGVSANGDGLNEVFQLDCIDYFPGNLVKIFNRAGELVYETTNYDNLNNAFRGEGNRGLYLGSEQLPIGTYFFVVDLKDGTELQTGYLELVR
jgi:large repetitive protein